MGRETAEVIEQLMSQQMFTAILYELQLLDYGSGTFSGTIITDSTKTWMASEWAVDTSVLVDVNGNRYPVIANTTSTATVSIPVGTADPASGEYTIERWFYITSHLENLDTDGKPVSFTYGEDEFSRSKTYFPYPINHKMLHDHELGRFPQLNITVFNPAGEAFSQYYNLESFDFYSLFERYSALRGNIVNITLIFIDEDGDIITDPSTVNIANQFTITKSDIARDKITFILTSLGNFSDKKIPSRTFSKATCSWVYKGKECAYSASDPTLTTELTRCNKLLKSSVFSSEKDVFELTYVSGNNYQLPGSSSDNRITIPEDMEEYVIGCIVECTKANYLWRVTGITTTDVANDTLTIESYGNTRSLSEFENEETETIIVSIYEKECCFGHSDTGTTYVMSTFANNNDYTGFCKFNDIAFNGDFNTLGIYGGPLAPWLSSGSLTPYKSYVFGTGATTLAQIMYVYGIPSTHSPLETGKKFAFIIRYYGANTVNDGVDRYLSYQITAGIGGTKYWNAATNEFQIGSVSNTVLLRPYSQRLGVADFDDSQKGDVRYMLFDEEIAIVVLEYGSLQAQIGSIAVNITTPADTEIVYNYIAMIMYNQFERFGGFPAIPTSRYWYF